MQRGTSFQMMAPWTKAVKWLVIANVAIFVLFQLIVEGLVLRLSPENSILVRSFGLTPSSVIHQFFVWQPLTYMFLHSAGGMTHLLFNMLVLWWTGAELEARWGARFFTAYYFASGVGAGILYVLSLVVYRLITGSTEGWYTPVIGASGAMFGLILAYGIIFSERVVLFMMIFPMKAKYLAMLMGGIAFLSLLMDGMRGDVSHLAHLAGAVSGFIFLRTYAWYQSRERLRRSAARSGRRLKLVVNNDRKDQQGSDEDGGPRYWN